MMDRIGSAADAGYVPHDGEDFMGERQLAWFRSRLSAWREDILRSSGATLDQLRDVSLKEPDMTDRAANEADWATQLRTRDRQRKLLGKIAAAIRRIDEGEYGFCDVTGEAIALGRLIARPTATMTIEAQESHERRERSTRVA